jgi:hypothetical protein
MIVLGEMVRLTGKRQTGNYMLDRKKNNPGAKEKFTTI